MKKIFPLLKEYYDLHYFDSAATTLKPQIVIDAIFDGYTKYTLPIGKSIYKEAEYAFDKVILPVQCELKSLFNAETYDIFFGHSITGLFKQILEFYFLTLLQSKDNKIISILYPETVHDSFFLQLVLYKNIHTYAYNMDNLNDFLNKMQFDLVYIPIIDHITGTEIDYNRLKAYKKIYPNTIIIADASQSGMYQNQNLSDELFDFFLLNSHKMYGPDGLAIVMITKKLIHNLNNTFHTKPISIYFLKNFFAQGSLPNTSLYGFISALFFLKKTIYFNNEYKKKQTNLLHEIYQEIQNNKNLITLSQPHTKTMITFYHTYKNAHDIASDLSIKSNICIRSGDLCSSYKIHASLGLLRISFGCYNNESDTSILKSALSRI